jgi:hypothetical protein
MVYEQNLVRIEFAYSVLEYEAQGTEIASTAVRVVESYEFNLMEDHGFVVQLLELIVHKCRYDIQFLACLRVGYALAPFP